MKIPLSYNSLTVRDFIECKKIEQGENKRMNLVSYFTKVDAETIPLFKLKWLLFKVDTLLASKIKDKITPTVWINNRRYAAITDVSRISTNQATMFKQLTKDSKGEVNLDKLLGLVYYRNKIGSKAEFNTDVYNEVCKDMLDVKVGNVAPTVFFYLKVLETLNLILPYYLMEAMETIAETLKEMKAETLGVDLESSMAGTM